MYKKYDDKTYFYINTTPELIMLKLQLMKYKSLKKIIIYIKIIMINHVLNGTGNDVLNKKMLLFIKNYYN